MQVPLEITFRGMNHSAAVEGWVNERAAKLDKIYNNIISCRVAVEKPQSHQKSGSSYRIRVEIYVPHKHQIIVKREAGEGDMHDNLYLVIKDAFEAALRQLKALKEKQRNEIKTHPDQEVQAVIARLFPDEGYGFIQTIDGREVYFHRNSVLHNDFDSLKVGTGVRFAEEMGDDGPQASSVQILDKSTVE